MKAIVWSKPACGYCVKAKNLLKSKGIEYEEKNIAVLFTDIVGFTKISEGLKPKEVLDLLSDYQTQGIVTDVRSIERLAEFKINNGSIVLTERSPIQIAINSKISRNWEGIVRFDREGFLIATDKYPRMILGFVPLNP